MFYMIEFINYIYIFDFRQNGLTLLFLWLTDFIQLIYALEVINKSEFIIYSLVKNLLKITLF